MGNAVSQPLVDGRVFIDSEGKEHTVIYSENVFTDIPGNDVNMKESVVLLDPEWDVVVITLDDFEENYSEIPESMYTGDLFN